MTFELSPCRHKKNRDAAVELLMRLKDNRDLQKFLQDCQEVQIRILVWETNKMFMFMFIHARLILWTHNAKLLAKHALE